jgi:outer membrane protein
MKRSSVGRMGVFAAGLVVVAGWADAQQANAQAKAPRIAVVDIERMVAETELGKKSAEQANKIRAELRAEGEKRQAGIGKLDERLQQQQELLIKDQATLSPDATEQRQQALSKLTRERESYRQDSEDVLGGLQRRLQREQQRIEGELQEKLAVFIQGIVAERGFELVLDRRVCLAVSPTIDVTDDVIQRADAGQGRTAPAAAGATPKAPAASKPQPKK